MNNHRILSNVGLHGSPSRNNGGRVSSLLAPQERQSLISVEQTDESSNHPEMVTISLGPIYRPGTGQGFATFAALLQWGGDGSSSEAWIDWRNGCCVSIPAGMVRLTAVNEDTTGLEGSVSAHVGYGTRSNSRSASRTVRAPASVNVPIPPMALGVWTSVQGSSFDFLDSVGVVLAPGSMVPIGGAMAYSPIPNGACFVVSADNLVWVFDLSL